MRKLSWFAGGFALAAAACVYVLTDALVLWLAGACLALSIVGKLLGIRRLAVALLGAGAAFLWCNLYPWIAGTEVVIPDDAQVLTVRISAVPHSSVVGASVYATWDDQNVVIYGPEELLDCRPGDLVTMTAEVEQTSRSALSGEGLFFRARGANYVIFAKSELTIVRGEPAWPETVSMWLQERIQTLYQGEEAGFLMAILTGERSGLTFSTRNELSVAGLSHAIAVSGMHVSMLLMLISFLCGKNPRLTALLGIPAVIAFALVTGASASVCRAAFMHILLLTAPLFGRDHDTLTSLSAAALVLLLINPWAVADASFQLSFAAVLGLITLSGPIQKRILSLWKKSGRVRRFVAGTVSATLSATFVTLPLIVIYFGQVSLAALPVNLLSLWAVTVVFTLGLLSCLLGPVGIVLSWPVTLLVKWILLLCDIVSRFPYAAAYVEAPALLIWTCAAYILAAVVLLSGKKLPLWSGLSVMTAAFVICVFLGRWNLCRGDLTFTADDVGQGQSLILHTDDCTAVIDCGGSYRDEAGESVVRILHSAGITQIDALIVTHFDADHTGGISQLLQRVNVGSILVPDYQSPYRDEVETAAAAANVPVSTVTGEALVEFSSGWIRLMAAETGSKGNDAGLCVLAQAADFRILVTGDQTAAGELYLMTHWPIPQVDLLVAGHHGAADSTSGLLLEQTQPETVLISVKAGNAYGHPAPELLQRLENAGAKVLRTDELGTITIPYKTGRDTDGKKTG